MVGTDGLGNPEQCRHDYGKLPGLWKHFEGAIAQVLMRDANAAAFAYKPEKALLEHGQYRRGRRSNRDLP